MDILSIFLGLLLLIGAVAFAVFAVWFAVQFLSGMWNVGRDKPQARPGQGAVDKTVDINRLMQAATNAKPKDGLAKCGQQPSSSSRLHLAP